MAEHTSDTMISEWSASLACPRDHTPLVIHPDHTVVCPSCGYTPLRDAARHILDFRVAQVEVTQKFTFPVKPLDRYQLMEDAFIASRAKVQPSPITIKTRLGKDQQFYCYKLLEEVGADAVILDLGCGSGDNTRFLKAIGFKHVLPVDWSADGAACLVDAHVLPFVDGAFDMVVSTAVFEHLYNPFAAMHEISRVLKPGGRFVGSASFWEAWHGSSYFHMTPDGWNAVLTHAGMSLEDLSAGWGVIPPLIYHVLIPGKLRRIGYGLQGLVDRLYRLTMGEKGLRRLQLRASGSYQVYARKRGSPS